MKNAETCSSLCSKLYTYLYHHTVVLDKYIQSNLLHKGYIYVYNLLHNEQLHVSALFIGHFQVINLKMANKNAETYSCSLYNKLYTYLYHHIVVLDNYIQSNLVYTKVS